MVALLLISTVGEIFIGVVAILILAMGVFGLDSIVFSKQRKTGRDPRAPKQRISFVVEDDTANDERVEKTRR